MENLIDKIASSSWLFLVLFIIALNVAGFLFFRKPFKNKLINSVLGISIAVFCVIALVYITLGEYGYAVEFIDIQDNGKEICLMERHETGDGDGGSYTVYRLYVVDMKTGKRLLRMTSSYSEMLCVTDDGVIIFEPTRAVKLDFHTGDETEEWSAEKGFEKFPELKSGVNNLSRESRIINGRQKGFLTITAMDGHEFYFDLHEEKLYPGRVPHFEGEYQNDYKFDLRTKTGEIKELVTRLAYQEEHVYPGEFLDPEILVRNDKGKFLIIKHYASLDKRNAILTAINYKMEKIWQVEQNSLTIKDHTQENPVFGTYLSVGDKLFVSFGGTLFCMDALNGTELWRSAL